LKFKKGDTVEILTVEEINQIVSQGCCSLTLTEAMKELCGKKAIIKTVDPSDETYMVEGIYGSYWWEENWMKKLPHEVVHKVEWKDELFEI